MNKCTEISIIETCKFLSEHDNYAILTHMSPDGDALGSGFGLCMVLRSLGKKAEVVCPDGIPEKFKFITDSIKPDGSLRTTVVSVDIADEKLLGSARKEYEGRISLAIDHHVSNTGYSELLYLDVKASAVCECIYDIAKQMNVPLNLQLASAVYTGISTDSGCFKYGNTTPKTHRIAAELMEIGINFAEINRAMFDTKSRERLKMESMAVENAEYWYDGQAVVMFMSLDMIRESGCTADDLEGLSAIARCVEGISVAATVREREEGVYKVSLRTFGGVDASEICSEFGGGGHKVAAGCVISGTPDGVKKRLQHAIGGALELI